MQTTASLQNEAKTNIPTGPGKTTGNPLQLVTEVSEEPLPYQENPLQLRSAGVSTSQNPLQMKPTGQNPLQFKAPANNPFQLPQFQNQPSVQKKANNTGLPDDLKSGVENLSGYSMDDVIVHYNNNEPAQLQALAYAQGTDTHVAPGQEKHLPHEAWHVVQQKQGRVEPTLQMKEGVAVNVNKGLEQEADVMGQQSYPFQTKFIDNLNNTNYTSHSVSVIQRVFDQESVKNAIMETKSTQRMIDMGGTTGGAYNLDTNSPDPDVRKLVIKAGGRSSAVLASNIFKKMDIPTPESLMLPLTTEVLKKIKALGGDSPKFGTQLSIEVQQHTSILDGHTGIDETSKLENEARILAIDTLTGNVDRHDNKSLIHPYLLPTPNIVGRTPIDNTVNDSETNMIGKAKEIVDNALKIHNQIEKVSGRLKRNSTIDEQLLHFKIQKQFLLGLQDIVQKSDDIKGVIRIAEQKENDQTQEQIKRLLKMQETKVEGEVFEVVIGKAINPESKDSASAREEIIKKTISDLQSKLMTNHYENLINRLDHISTWNIRDALDATNLHISELKQKLDESKKPLVDWQSEKQKAESSNQQEWNKKSGISKIFSSKKDLPDEKMKQWLKDNPRPN